MFCLRTTLGCLPLDGTGALTDRAAVAVASRAPGLLLQCCKALGLPAGAHSQTYGAERVCHTYRSCILTRAYCIHTCRHYICTICVHDTAYTPHTQAQHTRHKPTRHTHTRVATTNSTHKSPHHSTPSNPDRLHQRHSEAHYRRGPLQHVWDPCRGPSAGRVSACWAALGWAGAGSDCEPASLYCGKRTKLGSV